MKCDRRIQILLGTMCFLGGVLLGIGITTAGLLRTVSGGGAFPTGAGDDTREIVLEAIHPPEDDEVDETQPSSLPPDSLAIAHISIHNRTRKPRIFLFSEQYGKGAPQKDAVFATGWFGGTHDVDATISCWDTKTGELASRTRCLGLPMDLEIRPRRSVELRLEFRTPPTAGTYDVEVRFSPPRDTFLAVNSVMVEDVEGVEDGEEEGEWDVVPGRSVLGKFVEGSDRAGPIRIE